MKALEKLKQRLIGYVHIQSGLWLKNKGLVITSEDSSTPVRKTVLPNVERTPTQKILDELEYHAYRMANDLPMPELRVRETYSTSDGYVYGRRYYWWYPSDWDFEKGGRK